MVVTQVVAWATAAVVASVLAFHYSYCHLVESCCYSNGALDSDEEAAAVVAAAGKQSFHY